MSGLEDFRDSESEVVNLGFGIMNLAFGIAIGIPNSCLELLTEVINYRGVTITPNNF